MIVTTKQIDLTLDLDLLHEVGSRIAAGDLLDEALAIVVNFATSFLQCSSCFVYVRERGQFVLSVWQASDRRTIDETNVLMEQGIVEFLTENRLPAAVTIDACGKNRCRTPPEWSKEKGETCVSIPLLSRSKLVGVINLRHQQPRIYSRAEIELLSSVSFLLGAEIGITRLECENADLLLELETRKLVERGKGILQRELGLNEEQAYMALQQQSRQRRKSMREIAQAVILGEEVRRSALAN